MQYQKIIHQIMVGSVLQDKCIQEGGMENENFKAYAPEDKERFYRFTTLGYSVGR